MQLISHRDYIVMLEEMLRELLETLYTETAGHDPDCQCCLCAVEKSVGDHWAAIWKAYHDQTVTE